MHSHLDAGINVSLNPLKFYKEKLIHSATVLVHVPLRRRNAGNVVILWIFFTLQYYTTHRILKYLHTLCLTRISFFTLVPILTMWRKIMSTFIKITNISKSFCCSKFIKFKIVIPMAQQFSTSFLLSFSYSNSLIMMVVQDHHILSIFCILNFAEYVYLF